MGERTKISVRGIVQGVGFRPYVYTVATSLCLMGYVANTADGVDIEVEGQNVGEFLPSLVSKPPPQARIDEIRSLSLPLHGYDGFHIIKSIDSPNADRPDASSAPNGSPITFMPADISTCDDCQHELLNPADRRYLYPFINCVNCGPRYTIIKSLPYDRESTTMSVFKMCEDCGHEYDNPRNRRFHAQPNACPKCGPTVELVYSDKYKMSNTASNPVSNLMSNKETEPIRKAVELLKDGAIIAIKGLGGFHIACDAANDAAVRRLRTQKRKNNKPFAVMVAGVSDAADLCFLSDDEKNLLQSYSRPIVLLRKKGNHLSPSVSPENRYYGVMLPYTPLHYLLFYYPLHGIAHFGTPGTPHFKALVMTSGNISETPVISENAEALRLLSESVDGFLLHDRDIYNRVDDSVLFVTHRGTPMFVRRGRGFVPVAIGLPGEGPQVVAVGADVKNTFALAKGKYLIPGPHIGDMGNYETLEFFEKSMSSMMNTFRIIPEAIACDLHPGYFSTTLAAQMRSAQMGSTQKISAQMTSILTKGMENFAIQHHHAHIGSVMAEHGLTSKVIGVVVDGTGYGEDGNLWGGEFMVAGVSDFTRAGHFKYIALPGGEMAIRQPIRMAISLIADAWGDGANEILEKLGFIEKYGKYFIETIMAIIAVKEVSPLSSGAGRLFDAVGAMLGICDINTYEAESAIRLESIIDESIKYSYPFDINNPVDSHAKSQLINNADNQINNDGIIIDFSKTVKSIVKDILGGMDKSIISAIFHNTVVSAIVVAVVSMRDVYDIRDVVLSGGVFQNRYMLWHVVTALETCGFTVFINAKVPCNDGGISVGQAYIARERLKKR